MGAFLAASGPFAWVAYVLAVVAVVLAVQYLRTARRELVPAAISTAAGALLAGALCAVTGFQRAVGPLMDLAPDRRWLYLLGVSEALNGLAVALAACLLAALLLGAGGWRAGRSAGTARARGGAMAGART